MLVAPWDDFPGRYTWVKTNIDTLLVSSAEAGKRYRDVDAADTSPGFDPGEPGRCHFAAQPGSEYGVCQAGACHPALRRMRRCFGSYAAFTRGACAAGCVNKQVQGGEGWHRFCVPSDAPRSPVHLHDITALMHCRSQPGWPTATPQHCHGVHRRVLSSLGCTGSCIRAAVAEQAVSVQYCAGADERDCARRGAPCPEQQGHKDDGPPTHLRWALPVLAAAVALAGCAAIASWWWCWRRRRRRATAAMSHSNVSAAGASEPQSAKGSSGRKPRHAARNQEWLRDAQKDAVVTCTARAARTSARTRSSAQQCAVSISSDWGSNRGRCGANRSSLASHGDHSRSSSPDAAVPCAPRAGAGVERTGLTEATATDGRYSLAAAKRALDAMRCAQPPQLFAGAFELLPERCRGGQAFVQFARRAAKSPDASGSDDAAKQIAIKLFARHSDFELEARLYQEAALRAVLPPLLATHAPGSALPPCLVMERGCTLDEWARPRRSYLALLAMLQEVSALLATMHAASLVHRDLKPANVLFMPQSLCWKLIDVGIAARAGAIAPVKATLAYAAPEVLRAYEGGQRLRVDPAHDVWALGALALTVLLGKPFHSAFEDRGVLFEYARGARTYPWETGSGDAMPAALARSRAKGLILRCLQRDPAQRISARQLEQAVLQQVSL